MTPCKYATGEIDSYGHTLGFYPKAQRPKNHTKTPHNRL